jgi:hypothetical protein
MSADNATQNKSILSMQDLMILHANHIYPQSHKDDVNAYKHLYGIDMQIHSIPKSPQQKAQEMELSDLHHEEFKIFALEYNTYNTEPTNQFDHYVNTLQQHNEDFDPGINDMFLNNLDPTFYAMQMQNPDVLTHAQMKRQVDANKFVEVQRPEIDGLMDINTFESIPKINLPHRARYLDLIWTNRRKRRPDGYLKKYKARLCVNGSRQIQGIDYTESFAPVVQGSTIRMANTLAAMHNLKGKQIDFAQDFIQAKLKEDIYVRFPAGFEHKNDKWALKLKRNLYGLVQASRNWFLRLSAIYERLGFKQSKSDPCMFLRKDMLIVLYTDDCLRYARDTTDIDSFIKTLSKDYKITLNDPYPIDNFLGVNFSHQDNVELHMSQTGLIDAVTESAHIPKGRLKNTETPSTAILHADAEGLARQESWNYPSVIGQLNYLAQNLQPDISFTVHQCARFSKASQALHEKAVKCIIYYLQRTRDKPLIIKPNKNLSLDAYCDIDFAGVWHQ